MRITMNRVIILFLVLSLSVFPLLVLEYINLMTAIIVITIGGIALIVKSLSLEDDLE